MTIRSWTACINFIVLVVQNQELLPFGVKNPTLMCVRGTLIGGYGDNLGPLLVGDII